MHRAKSRSGGNRDAGCRRIHMLDIAYILIALLFFVAMWGLTKACERL